ncbi:MAG: tetratricopeptide repeat protein, partial [Pseudobdellovibrionaceae bacterium]
MTHRSRMLLALLAATSLTACEPQDNTNLWNKFLGFLNGQDASEVKESLEDKTVKAEPFEGASTLSGAYLVGRHAQISQDWSTAARAFQTFISSTDKTTEDMVKRTMVLSIGGGDMDTAIALAQDLKETGKDNTALSQLVLLLKAAKDAKYDEAQKLLTSMPPSGISEIVRPVLSIWIDQAKGKSEIPQFQTMNGLTIYHQFLAADTAGDIKRLTALASLNLGGLGLGPRSIEQIGDILYRHNLKEQALREYEMAVAGQTELTEIETKIAAIKQKVAIPDETLMPKVASATEGLAKALVDMATLFYQEGGTDSARLFAQMSLFMEETQEEAHILLAHIAIDTGHEDEAIAFFNSISKDKGNEYILAQRQVADLYEGQEHYDTAAEVLTKLVKETDSLEAQIQLGDLYRHREDYRRSLEAYDKAFTMIEDKDAPENWALYYSRGIDLERLGRFDEAEKDLLKALSFQPDHPYILNYLGYSYADQGIKLDQSLKMIRKAVQLQPEDGYITDSLGWVYFRLGEYDNALPYLEKAVELLPYDATVNDHL